MGMCTVEERDLGFGCPGGGGVNWDWDEMRKKMMIRLSQV